MGSGAHLMGDGWRRVRGLWHSQAMGHFEVLACVAANTRVPHPSLGRQKDSLVVGLVDAADHFGQQLVAGNA